MDYQTKEELLEAVSARFKKRGVDASTEEIEGALKGTYAMVKTSRGYSSDTIALAVCLVKLKAAVDKLKSDEAEEQAHRDYLAGRLQFNERPKSEEYKRKLARIEANQRFERNQAVALATARLSNLSARPMGVAMAHYQESQEEARRNALAVYRAGPPGGW